MSTDKNVGDGVCRPENVSPEEFNEAGIISAEQSELQPDQAIVTYHDGIQVVHMPKTLRAIPHGTYEAMERHCIRDVVSSSVAGFVVNEDMINRLLFGPVAHYDS